MIRRKDCEYLTLDGMPFVVGPDHRNWVFATTTERWEPYGSDDWDAVYVTSNWNEIFGTLPDLPQRAAPHVSGAGEGYTIGTDKPVRKQGKTPYKRR